MKTSLSALRRIPVGPPGVETVHFHLGNDGLPTVCDIARCESPAISEMRVSRRTLGAERRRIARRRPRRARPRSS
jgi:hypothetical protein